MAGQANGYSLTISDTNVHNLMDLIRTADSTSAPFLSRLSRMILEADAGNGASIIYFGGTSVASNNYGFSMGAGVQLVQQDDNGTIYPQQFNLKASAQPVTLHVNCQP